MPVGRAGFPATLPPGATSRVTTLPAPTTAASPLETPGKTIEPEIIRDAIVVVD